MNRVFNFSAGPSTLPMAVLERAQKDLISYGDAGMSVMEMSHRSPMFDDIIKRAEQNMRDLMQIPDNYAVLFLQGGASTQFASVPMNLSKGQTCCYVDSGAFAGKAIAEGKRFADVQVVASSKEDGYTYVPEVPAISPDAAYLHITTNNTIYGTRYNVLPETGDVPLVADMSSDILGREMDVSKFGLIYAGAQKNIAPAGMTLVIIRKDLIGNALGITPTMLDYKTMVDKGSMYNTPPCWPIYICMLTCEWIKSLGGVKAIEAINAEKANLLYDVIDSSSFFTGHAKVDSRSHMNVTFTLPNDELTKTFVAGAAERNLFNIKGHRSVGGIRASIYNAMPIEGVVTLRDYMVEFEKDNK